jgi:hypothetical protein
LIDEFHKRDLGRGEARQLLLGSGSYTNTLLAFAPSFEHHGTGGLSEKSKIFSCSDVLTGVEAAANLANNNTTTVNLRTAVDFDASALGI